MKLRGNSNPVLLFALCVVCMPAFLALFACNPPLGNAGLATVSIALGGEGGPLKAIAKAPSSIGAIGLTVSGPGLTTLNLNYSSDTANIVLEVPPGTERLFELNVEISAASSSSVTSWVGSTTTDLATGESKGLSIAMGVNETKILLPDSGEYVDSSGGTPQLIQIDDISGAGYTQLVAGDLGGAWIGNFAPFDVDIANDGRIYIANGHNSFPKIWRIDSITDNSAEILVSGAGNGFIDVTIDRKNALIFYATSSTLHRANLDGSGATTLGSAGITTIQGMNIDDDGILYIAGNAGGARIFKYNPASQSVTASYGPGVLSSPWDVLVKDNFLYVANYQGASGWRIVRLTKNLTSATGYGTDPGSGANHSQGAFYGAVRFVAILNRKITLMDDYDSAGFCDKLVSMTDINGAGWQTFPSTGDGQGFFTFYYGC